MARVRSPRRSPVDNHNEQDEELEKAYAQAVQTLCHLKSTRGALFLGCSRFLFWPQYIGKVRKADGTNVLKGCEDALNNLAWEDDIQNDTIEQENPFR